MATWYSLRVTPVEEGVFDVCSERLQKFLAKHAESYVVCREYGKKQGGLHFQCWATTHESRKNFSQNLRNMMGDGIAKGNKGAGMNEEGIRCPEALQRYVMKGERRGALPHVICGQVLNFGDEYIETYHNAYWDQNDAMVASVKEKKTGLYQQLMDFAISHNGVPTREELCQKYVQICMEIDKPIDVFRARPVVNLVWSKSNPAARQMIVDEMMSRI